jgi:predicted XRE-type DNA-binding protein
MASKSEMERVAEELAAIKRLMIAGLQRDGMSQEALAAALGVNQSSISRMFAKGGGPTRRRTGARQKANSEATDA